MVYKPDLRFHDNHFHHPFEKLPFQQIQGLEICEYADLDMLQVTTHGSGYIFKRFNQDSHNSTIIGKK